MGWTIEESDHEKYPDARAERPLILSMMNPLHVRRSPSDEKTLFMTVFPLAW